MKKEDVLSNVLFVLALPIFPRPVGLPSIAGRRGLN